LFFGVWEVKKSFFYCQRTNKNSFKNDLTDVKARRIVYFVLVITYHSTSDIGNLLLLLTDVTQEFFEYKENLYSLHTVIF